MHIANLFSADSLVFYFLLATCFLLSQSLARLSVQIVTTESLLTGEFRKFLQGGGGSVAERSSAGDFVAAIALRAIYGAAPTSRFISLSASDVVLTDSAAADVSFCRHFSAYNQRLFAKGKK